MNPVDLRARLMLTVYLGAIFAGASFLSGGMCGGGGGHYESTLSNK
jgi:hypothetical protein